MVKRSTSLIPKKVLEKRAPNELWVHQGLCGTFSDFSTAFADPALLKNQGFFSGSPLIISIPKEKGAFLTDFFVTIAAPGLFNF